MTRPNILLLCSDMIGAKNFGCYGDPAGITPNVNRLAESGTRFDQAYCACPPCIPARVCMMTGQYAHTNGKMAHIKMQLHPRPRVIPEILSAHGYRTAVVGKTHWWPPADNLGCDEAYLTIDNHLTPELGNNDSYIQFLREKNLFDYNESTWDRNLIKNLLMPDNLPFECLKVNWTGGKACSILERFAEEDKPFFLFCSFVEPHGHGSVQSEFLEQFKDIPLPPIIRREGEHENKPETQRKVVRRWTKGLTEEDMYNYRRGIYASVNLVDMNIGKIMDRLEFLDLKDSTVIIFLTDHGDLMYDHGCKGKSYLYDSAARIPFIVGGPGITKGGTRQHLISQIDLLPTIMDLCGIEEEKEWNIEGKSVVPIIKNPASHWRDMLFSEVEQMNTVDSVQDGQSERLASSSQAKMLRTGPWKYIYTLVDGHKVEEELYNLTDDPDELYNLAQEQDQKELTTGFRFEILRWMVATEVNRLRPESISHYAVPRIDKMYF